MKGFIFIFIFVALCNADVSNHRTGGHEHTHEHRNDTYFTFSFDDTFNSGLEMVKPLEKCKWRATFYVSPMRLSCISGKYLTWKNVHRLYKRGHEIGSHGLSHEKSFDLDLDALKNQFCLPRAFLRRFKVESFAYPFAQVNDTIKNVVKECGYSNARSTSANLDLFESVPPKDVFEISSYSVRREDTFEDLKKRVDDALNAPLPKDGKHKWIIFNFHIMCNRKGDSCYNRYKFSVVRSVYNRFVIFIKALEDWKHTHKHETPHKNPHSHQHNHYSKAHFKVKNVKYVLKKAYKHVSRIYDGVDLPSDFVFVDENSAIVKTFPLLVLICSFVLIL